MEQTTGIEWYCNQKAMYANGVVRFYHKWNWVPDWKLKHAPSTADIKSYVCGWEEELLKESITGHNHPPEEVELHGFWVIE